MGSKISWSSLIEGAFFLIVSILCGFSVYFSFLESRLNDDVFHWTYMYAPAMDILRGKIPIIESFENYGLLSAAINAVALFINNEKFVTIGYAAGIFYAISLFFTFLIWRKLLGAVIGLTVTVAAFFTHPFIIYPWPNYYAYTFTLASILFILYADNRKKYFMWAGVFTAFSVLCRYTYGITTVVPIMLYFLYLYMTSSHRELRSQIKSQTLQYVKGGSIVAVLFFGPFVLTNTYTLWEQQAIIFNRKLHEWIMYAHGNREFFEYFIENMLNFKRQAGLLYYTICFYFCSALILIFLLRPFFKTLRSKLRNEILLVTLVGFFGYFHALHLYETFRLGNAVSIAFGAFLVVPLVFAKSFLPSWLAVCMVSLLSIPSIMDLSKSLKETGGSYKKSWPIELKERLDQSKNKPKVDNILEGVAWKDDVLTTTQAISAKIKFAAKQCNLEYIVNLTNCNTIFTYIDHGLKHTSRYYCDGPTTPIRKMFRSDFDKIDKQFAEKKAVLVNWQNWVPPGYKKIHSQTNYYLGIPDDCEFPEEWARKTTYPIEGFY